MDIPVWCNFKTQKQWQDYITHLLHTNDAALLRATVLIYNNQTPSEQMCGKAVEDDKKGFNKVDAPLLSRLAKNLLHGRGASQNDIRILRYRVPKYWRQLMVVGKLKAAKLQLQILEDESQAMLGAVRQVPDVCECPCEYNICSECPNQMHFEV